MPLESPTYIPVNAIMQPDLDYEWSDWDPYEPLGWPDENTKDCLRKASNRGITAFAIGCAEWVVYRLSRFSSDQTPYDFLEACWIFVMGNDDALPPESEESEWKGPIRGATDLALMTIINTWYLSEDGPEDQNGALAAQIALHVLHDKSAFLKWQEKALDRLIKYCRRDDEDPDGPPVPREILDPSVDLDSVERDGLIEAFLSKVDYSSNRFMRHLEASSSTDSA